MFTFPQETSTAHVALTTAKQDFGAVTVCLRSFTDLTRDHSLFSLATPNHPNDLLLYKKNNGIDLSIRDTAVSFPWLDYKVNTWHSICTTWDSVSGVAQLWLDGKHTARKYVSSGSHISGPIIIILGQEQDSHGGGFVLAESFAGMLSDVHMWNHTVPRQDILNYMDNMYFSPGNVLNWLDLEFQIVGRVLVEER